MSARGLRMLRVAVLTGWLVLALIAVVPVLAQDGGTTSQAGAASETSQPADLNDVAARLAPLLVGAALIERLLEFLFSWSERAALDATATARGLATRITGMVHVDIRQGWDELSRLTNAMVQRKTSGAGGGAGDPTSEDPADWPLADLEARLAEVQATVAATEARLQQILASDLYKQRKKMMAAVLSIVLGVALAIAANLRLFQALDVTVSNWFAETFDVLDLILAGVLMGLGTDWVHQIINILTKGQGFLGRAGGGGSQLDPEEVRALAAEALQAELDAQWKRLREQAEQEIGEITGRDTSPG